MTQQEIDELKEEIKNSAIPVPSQQKLMELLEKEEVEDNGERCSM